MALYTLSVVFYNEQGNLTGLLESFEKTFETDSKDFEFLFIDNCSSDGSVLLLKKWIKKNSQLKCHLIQRAKNHLGEARQQAVDEAVTPWIIFIDGDTSLSADWLESLEKIMGKLPEGVAAIGGEANYLEDSSWHRFAVSLDQAFPWGKKGERQVNVDHVPTNNCILNCERVNEAGGFDLWFSRVGEDLDLSQRLRKHGSIVYAPSLKVSHHLPARRHKWFVKMAFYGRAQSYIFLKYGGGIPWIKFVPAASVVAAPLFFMLFPLITLIFLAFILLIPRTQFMFLSVLYYGLGEWVGAVQFLFSGKLLQGARSLN